MADQTSSKRIEYRDDDEDDEPLSVGFSKSSAGASSRKPYDSNEKKPLASKVQTNGTSTTDKETISSFFSSKRPLDAKSCEQSSVKRPKVSDPSTSIKNKQVSAKNKLKEGDDDDDDDIAISVQAKEVISDNKSSATKKKVTNVVGSSSIKKTIKKDQKPSKCVKYSKSTLVPQRSNIVQKKWTTLVHSGVIFHPEYKPHGVKMLYNGKPVDLNPAQEEVATMYAVMKNTEYVQKEIFRENFWKDWHEFLGKDHVIQNLDACDFTPIYDWYQGEKEKKKQMTTEEKEALKEDKLKQEEKYMWAIVDGVKAKVGNFRVEPPGLFRGRGVHPESGKLRRRIRPSDVRINIGKDAPIPECPIPGESWKEVRHDNTVTWLAFWKDPINQKELKYVFLAPGSSLMGQNVKEKYEQAMMLKKYTANIKAPYIKAPYTKDFRSKNTAKWLAVATYLIDKLALSTGNEKEEGEEADTVGCCSLKVENEKAIPANSLEARWKQREKSTVELLVQVSSKRKEGEQTEVSTKSEEDTIKLKAESCLEKNKEEIQKLEKEVSQLRLKSDSSKIAALGWGVDGSYVSKLADTENGLDHK